MSQLRHHANWMCHNVYQHIDWMKHGKCFSVVLQVTFDECKYINQRCETVGKKKKRWHTHTQWKRKRKRKGVRTVNVMEWNRIKWSKARTENTVTGISWHMQRGFFVTIQPTVHRLFLTDSTAPHCIDRNIFIIYFFLPLSFFFAHFKPATLKINWWKFMLFHIYSYDLFFNSNINLFISKIFVHINTVSILMGFIFSIYTKEWWICIDL